MVVIYLYKNDIFIIARCAGLGSGRPEEKPSTSEPLPVRLRELAGKLGWMNWEPMSLTDAKVRGGGHPPQIKNPCSREEGGGSALRNLRRPARSNFSINFNEFSHL